MELVGAGGKPHVQDIRATRYVCDQDSLALPESHMTSRLDASDDDALIAAARFSELLDIFADDDEMAAINAYSCTLSREPSPIHGCKETGSAFLPPALSFPPEKVSKKEPKMQATVPKKKGSIRRPHHNHGHDCVEKLQNWLFTHQKHPYPSKAELDDLAAATKLCKSQIIMWFNNARKRLLKLIR